MLIFMCCFKNVLQEGRLFEWTVLRKPLPLATNYVKGQKNIPNPIEIFTGEQICANAAVKILRTQVYAFVYVYCRESNSGTAFLVGTEPFIMSHIPIQHTALYRNTYIYVFFNRVFFRKMGEYWVGENSNDNKGRAHRVGKYGSRFGKRRHPVVRGWDVIPVHQNTEWLKPSCDHRLSMRRWWIPREQLVKYNDSPLRLSPSMVTFIQLKWSNF